MAMLITGTPGTGKSDLAKRLAKATGRKALDITSFVKRKKLSDGFDKRRKSLIVDEKRLATALVAEIKKDPHLIIDGHLSTCVPKRLVELCIVTLCDLKILRKRLQKRRYPKAKIDENMEAEIMRICADEARGKGYPLLFVDTTRRLPLSVIIAIAKEAKPQSSKRKRHP